MVIPGIYIPATAANLPFFSIAPLAPGRMREAYHRVIDGLLRHDVIVNHVLLDFVT